MKLPFKIAMRFLKSSKSQTILIALGIAIGVSVQIFVGTLIQGLQKSLINKTIGNSSQITITSKDDKFITNYSDIVDKVKNTNEKIVNLSPSADGAALINKDSKNYSVLVRGMNIAASDKIYNIKSRIYSGTVPQKDFEVLIGRDLQKELNVNIDDTIDILAASGNTKQVKVTGFYDLNVASLNKSWIITSIGTAQQIFSMKDGITSIEMQLTDVFKSDEIAKSLSQTLAPNLKVEDWKSQNASLLSGLSGQSSSSYMIQVFVLVAVLLGIASVLAISVVQKSKQIGILKAMGIKDSSASLIFLFQGFILGVIGAVLGIMLGILFGYSFSKFVLNPDGTPLVELYINTGFIAFSGIIAVASATLASLIPARSSSKLNPIEVIKNA